VADFGQSGTQQPVGIPRVFESKRTAYGNAIAIYKAENDKCEKDF
jgi:hypothetical protein